MPYIENWDKKFDIWNYEDENTTEVIQGKTYPKLRPISWGYQGIITVDGNGNVTSGIDLQRSMLPGDEFFDAGAFSGGCNFSLGNCLHEWGAYRDINGDLHYQSSIPTDGTWVGRSGLDVVASSPYGGSGLGINVELKEFLDERGITHYPDFSGVSLRIRGACINTNATPMAHYRKQLYITQEDYASTLLNWRNWNSANPFCVMITEEHFFTSYHFVGNNTTVYSAKFARKDGGTFTVTGNRVGVFQDIVIFKITSPLSEDQKNNIKIYSKWFNTHKLSRYDVLWFVGAQGWINPRIVLLDYLYENDKEKLHTLSLRNVPDFNTFPSTGDGVISTRDPTNSTPILGNSVWGGDSSTPLFALGADGETYFGGGMGGGIETWGVYTENYQDIINIIINGDPSIPGSAASEGTTIPTMVDLDSIGGAFPFDVPHDVVIGEQETDTNRILKPGTYTTSAIPISLLISTIKEARLQQVNIYKKEEGGDWVELNRNSYVSTYALSTGVVDLSTATVTIGGVTSPANINSATNYIRVRRESGESPLIMFKTGSKLSATDLNTDMQQILHRVEEVENNLNRDFELLSLKESDLDIYRDLDLLGDALVGVQGALQNKIDAKFNLLNSSIISITDYLFAALPFTYPTINIHEALSVVTEDINTLEETTVDLQEQIDNIDVGGGGAEVILRDIVQVAFVTTHNILDIPFNVAYGSSRHAPTEFILLDGSSIQQGVPQDLVNAYVAYRRNLIGGVPYAVISPTPSADNITCSLDGHPVYYDIMEQQWFVAEWAQMCELGGTSGFTGIATNIRYDHVEEVNGEYVYYIKFDVVMAGNVWINVYKSVVGYMEAVRVSLGLYYVGYSVEGGLTPTTYNYVRHIFDDGLLFDFVGGGNNGNTLIGRDMFVHPHQVKGDFWENQQSYIYEGADELYQSRIVRDVRFFELIQPPLTINPPSRALDVYSEFEPTVSIGKILDVEVSPNGFPSKVLVGFRPNFYKSTSANFEHLIENLYTTELYNAGRAFNTLIDRDKDVGLEYGDVLVWDKLGTGVSIGLPIQGWVNKRFEISRDQSPKLGGNLDVRDFAITSSTNNISITADNLVLNSLVFPTVDGQPNDVMVTDGAGTLSFKDFTQWKSDPTATTTKLFDDLLWTGGGSPQTIDDNGTVGFLTLAGSGFTLDDGTFTGKHGVIKVTFSSTGRNFKFWGPHTIYPAVGQAGDKVLWEVGLRFDGISGSGNDFSVSHGFCSSGWVYNEGEGGTGSYVANKAFGGLCWSTQNQVTYPNLLKVWNNSASAGNPVITQISNTLLPNYETVWHRLGAVAEWDSQNSAWHISLTLDGVVVGTDYLSPASLGDGLCLLFNIFANTSFATTVYVDWFNLQFTRHSEVDVTDIDDILL